MIDDLKPLLQELPEPPTPSSITATVMARIARDVERRESARAALSQLPRERPVWVLAFAGAAIVLIAAVYSWLSTESLPDITSARIGLGRPELLPVEGPFVVALALGLFVYLAGLFAPLRSRSLRNVARPGSQGRVLKD